MLYYPHAKHKFEERRRGTRLDGRPEFVRPGGKGKPFAGAHEVRQERVQGVQVRQGASRVNIRVSRRREAQVPVRPQGGRAEGQGRNRARQTRGSPAP